MGKATNPMRYFFFIIAYLIYYVLQARFSKRGMQGNNASCLDGLWDVHIMSTTCLACSGGSYGTVFFDGIDQILNHLALEEIHLAGRNIPLHRLQPAADSPFRRAR